MVEYEESIQKTAYMDHSFVFSVLFYFSSIAFKFMAEAFELLDGKKKSTFVSKARQIKEAVRMLC